MSTTPVPMDELRIAMLAWLPCTLLPVLLVLLAPTAGPGARRGFAAALLGGAVLAALVGFLVAPDSGSRVLEVINPFIDPAAGKPVPFTVESARSPGWVLPLAAAALLLLPAVLLWRFRDRPPRPPCPVTFTLLVTAWTFAARLILEKAAAPAGLTWATGVTVPTLLAMPFVGSWCGRRGKTWAQLAGILLLIGLGQRAMVIAFALPATLYGLGTHLDVRAIVEVNLLLGKRQFSGDEPLRQWFTLIVVPQVMLWVPFTLIAGLTLGAYPFHRSRQP